MIPDARRLLLPFLTAVAGTLVAVVLVGLLLAGWLGQSWRVGDASGMRLVCVLERLENILEASRGHLRTVWASLGRILGSPRSALRVFEKPFWSIFN